jgi:hypothetical protein
MGPVGGPIKNIHIYALIAISIWVIIMIIIKITLFVLRKTNRTK